MFTSILVVDIGGTHLKFAAIESGVFRELGRHVSTAEIRTADPIDRLAALISRVSASLDLHPEAVVSTVPGFLDPDRDRVLFAGNVPELNGHRLATELSERLGLPVFLERDAVMALRGEWEIGAGAGARNLLGLFFGTGVGSAFLQDGEPFRGAGNALEMGVMPFRRDGRAMAGMRTDCLEAYVSGRTLQAIADRHDVGIARIFVEAAGRDDLTAELDGFLRDLMIAIGMAMHMFAPDTVLLGGGLCDMAGFPRRRIETQLADYAPYGEVGIPMNLRWASLGWKAALQGALHRANEAKRSTLAQDGPSPGKSRTSLRASF